MEKIQSSSSYYEASKVILTSSSVPFKTSCSYKKQRDYKIVTWGTFAFFTVFVPLTCCMYFNTSGLVSFSISQSSAHVILVQFVMLWFPITIGKSVMHWMFTQSKCYSYKILQLVLLGSEGFSLHKVAGIILIIFSISHTVTQVWAYIVSPQWYQSTFSCNTFMTCLITSRAGWTGVVMLLVLLIAIGIGYSFRKLKSGCYNFFLLTHALLYTLFVGCLLLHGSLQAAPGTTSWFSKTYGFLILPMVWYLIQRIIIYKNTITESATVLSASSSFIHLRVLTKTFKYLPGMYAKLNCPAVSRLEWHPFTIIRDENTLEFCIQTTTGDWTAALLREHLSSSAIVLKIRNISMSPLTSSLALYHHHSILCIAAGTGITPFLSLINNNSSTLLYRRIRIIWVARSAELLESFLTNISIDNISIEKYQTQPPFSTTTNVIRMRPEWDSIQYSNEDAIFFCGPSHIIPILKTDVAKRFNVPIFTECQ